MKFYYLDPKSHGSPQLMLTFAHELYESHNWHARFPFQIASVYDRLVTLVNDPKAVLETPEAWADMQLLFVPYLKAFPDNVSMRSRYCYYACRCGHWDEAKKQFELLGTDADENQFGGLEEMWAMKAEAKKK